MNNESLQSPPEVSHDTFFIETFGQKRIAVAFLKILLPQETAQQLDWDNLVAMPRHLSAEFFRGKVADVICRVPIKKSKRTCRFRHNKSNNKSPLTSTAKPLA